MRAKDGRMDRLLRIFIQRLFLRADGLILAPSRFV
jgi:hypothetical protein